MAVPITWLAQLGQRWSRARPSSPWMNVACAGVRFEYTLVNGRNGAPIVTLPFKPAPTSW